MSGDVFSRMLGFDSCHKDDDYGHQKSFSRQYDRSNYGSIVDEAAAKIARAAFGSSGNGHRRHYCFDGAGIWERVKVFSQQPVVKEALIIAAVFVFKGGLWFAYRKASVEGLDIADL